MKLRRPSPAKKGEINFSFIDRFTAIHFLIGVVYANIGLSLMEAFVLAVSWELVENPLKAYFPKFFPHASADTWRNALGDILAVCAGCSIYGLGYAITA